MGVGDAIFAFSAFAFLFLDYIETRQRPYKTRTNELLHMRDEVKSAVIKFSS